MALGRAGQVIVGNSRELTIVNGLLTKGHSLLSRMDDGSSSNAESLTCHVECKSPIESC